MLEGDDWKSEGVHTWPNKQTRLAMAPAKFKS